MYNPTIFREDDSAASRRLIDEFPFATIVSQGPAGLWASQLPFLLYPTEGKQGILRAHFARANPHWRELADTEQCIVIFQGAHGYVSPSWYPSKPITEKVVPTWNYATVHVWGKPTVVEDPAWLRQLVGDQTDRQEQRRPQPWAIGDAPADFIALQLKAIVGIEIPIARLEGKRKLSQNRNAEDFQGVVAGLRASGDPHENQPLAASMKLVAEEPDVSRSDPA